MNDDIKREHRKSGIIRLRAIEPEDLPDLKVWRNELKGYFREYRLLNSPHQEAWLESIRGDRSCLHYAVDVWDNRWLLIGSCNWSAIDWLNRRAELGIYIGDPEWRKKGVGLKAMIELHRIAFMELGFNMVHLEVWGFSDAEQFYYDFGYKLIGKHRQRIFHEGKFWDSVMMDMTHDEWREIYDKQDANGDNSGPL